MVYEHCRMVCRQRDISAVVKGISAVMPKFQADELPPRPYAGAQESA